MDLGVEMELIEKRGSFYSYQEQRISQGRENAKQYLRDNPEKAVEIEHKIRVLAGIITEENSEEPPVSILEPELLGEGEGS